MNYLSICSGIEAASVAWEKSLGWKPLAFAEIEPFPCAVLAHHWPEVPNLGDMTRYPEWPDARTLRPDLVVAGTPCQAFSVAGLRRGLADPRGNLTLVLLGILERYRPRWVVWENVPGVLSSVSDARPPATPPDPPLDLECDGQTVETHDDLGGDEVHAFHCFLAGLSELGYGSAYRVLDAQFAGVPQRRRRVFVVGYLGDWRRAAAVLFEPESLRGDSPPRREAGQGTAPTLSASAKGGGGLGTDFECGGGLIASTGEISHCLNAGGMGRLDLETETLIAHTLAAGGHDASEDGTGRGIPLVPICFDWAVRRLTPTECERLQGFPDGHTLIPWRGKPADLCPDGPRYKALGNSMAVPVMRWIGERIAACEALQLSTPSASAAA